MFQTNKKNRLKKSKFQIAIAGCGRVTTFDIVEYRNQYVRPQSQLHCNFDNIKNRYFATYKP
jgi:hypothetical protein